MNFLNTIAELRENRDDIEPIILFLGLDNSGKTTIINSLYGVEPCISPTYGYSIYRVPSMMYRSDGFSYFYIYDVGGQKSIRKYWSSFTGNIEGIVYVIDVSDTRDVDLNVVPEYHPVLFLCNKIDLLEEQDSLSELEKYLTKKIEKKFQKSKIFFCSAKTKEGTKEAFDWLLSQIHREE